MADCSVLRRRKEGNTISTWGTQTFSLEDAPPEDFFSSPSTLRKLHESVSDPKYAGMKTSRKDLLADSESEEVDEDDEPANEGFDDEDLDDGASTGPQESDGSASENDSSDEGGHSAEEDESQADVDVPKATPSRPAPPEESADVASALKQSRDEESKKGRAVKRQTVFYFVLPREGG